MGRGDGVESIGCSREGYGSGSFLWGQGKTHNTDTRDGIFAFCCLSQHDIGLVLR